MRVLHKEGTEHGQPAVGAILGLCIDIRHERILHLGTASESIGKRLADEPRFCGRSTMGTGVGREKAEWQPTAVDILGRCRNKPTHIVTPEREARKAQTQSPPQVAHHADIVGCGISTPM